jgi:hypothetical protein
MQRVGSHQEGQAYYNLLQLFHPPDGHKTEEEQTMEKIQVMLPEELIQYLKELVADPENPLQSVSGTIRWIIAKEMKTHEAE